jgi:hypothetical protein
MDHGDICIMGIRADLLLDMRDFAVMEDRGQKDHHMDMVVQDQKGRALEVQIMDLRDHMGLACKVPLVTMDIMDTMAQVVDQADQVDMEDGSLILSILR